MGAAPARPFPWCWITHEIAEAAMRDAVAAIGRLDSVVDAPALIRIEPG